MVRLVARAAGKKGEGPQSQALPWQVTAMPWRVAPPPGPGQWGVDPSAGHCGDVSEMDSESGRDTPLPDDLGSQLVSCSIIHLNLYEVFRPYLNIYMIYL